MGRDPVEPATPDLFSADGIKAAVPSSPTQGTTKKATQLESQRHILPKNLRHAVSQLSDGELYELYEAAFDEARRRGRSPRSVRTDLTTLCPSQLATKRLLPTAKRRRTDIDEVALTRGQVNAVRAAFKAGITPSQIARQFGISQSNVRRTLATDEPKRCAQIDL